jgi:hypothetical protein
VPLMLGMRREEAAARIQDNFLDHLGPSGFEDCVVSFCACLKAWKKIRSDDETQKAGV